MDTKSTIEFYTADDGQIHLDVRMENETVWLTQGQFVQLFDKNKRTISEHIQNIFNEGELLREETVRKSRTVQTEGKRQVTRDLEYYNLDVIISVGYRVKSQRGTQFRIWATNVLKEHLRKGYTLHTRRLEQQGSDVNALINLLENAVGKHALASEEGEEMIRIIRLYSSSFSLLQQYDKGTLPEPEGTTYSIQINIRESRKNIASLKIELMAKGEASDLFGKERGEAFAAIIGNIEQTFGGNPLYSTVEIRAAHLLYFIVKDHPFYDGNKRSAAFMFLLYLSRNGVLTKNGYRVINESGLVALTLLIAESDPTQKELMTRLIQNLIT